MVDTWIPIMEAITSLFFVDVFRFKDHHDYFKTYCQLLTTFSQTSNV
jgi:hypothetical protein